MNDIENSMQCLGYDHWIQASTDPEKMAKVLRIHIRKEISTLLELTPDQRIEGRLEKYSNMGKFTIIDDENESESKEKSDK